MHLTLKPLFTSLIIAGLYSSTSFAATVNINIIETTDLHANMMDYDYYKNKPSAQIGLVRDATLIKQLEKKYPNSLLVDNGDLIQGSPMGDYMADKGLKKGEVHPIYKAMNLLNYQVGNFGNHEFNYGLEFLKKAVDGARFPYINANIFDAKTGKHYFKPYLLKTYDFVDTDGQKQSITVGYIGFVPPQIMTWDKKNLEGKVIAKSITETAKQLIPQMQKEGAQVIIAIPHSGLSAEPYKALAENSVYYLSKVKGIDAIAFGHAHAVFPSKDFADIPGVNIEKGTINGVAAVMPGRWGSHVGLMSLTLNNDSGKWLVTDAQSESLPIYDKKAKKELVQADAEMRQTLEADHQHTQDFVNRPIGRSNAPMYSYLALVQDDPTVQIVNLAQMDYVKHFVEGDPDLDKLPILSAAAPFKVGGRKNDPENYTEVEAGQLTFRNPADLYLYPNTLVALKVTGKEVREWLECSAGQFNQINPNSTKPQTLINWDGFRTYNFDVIDGVKYQIDVTQPARYDGNCKLEHPNAHRISELTYQGKPVENDQIFLLATNNYRAYSGKFPGTGDEHIAFASPDKNRSILADYIRKVSHEKGEITPKADNNWSFKPIANRDVEILFETSPSEKAQKFIKEYGQYPIKKVSQDSNGFGVYRIQITK